MTKRLDRKIANILRDPSGSKDFIIADASSITACNGEQRTFAGKSVMPPTAILEQSERPVRRQRTSRRDVFVVLEQIPGRIRDIAVLRGLGYSYREIASPLGVTPQAVSLMLMRHKRCLKQLRSASELHSLSARGVNALGRHGITTRQDARAKDALTLLKQERNCGAKTIAEIKRWMADETGPAQTCLAGHGSRS